MSDGRIDYVRGASVDFDRRQATKIVGVLWFAALVVLLIVLTVSAIGQGSRTSRLQQHGVPVNVKVTSCFAIASGTGETVSGYTCQGTYTLQGQNHSGEIRGLNRSRPAGAIVPALADPAHPSTLSTAQALASTSPSWEGYIAPAIVLVLLVGSAGLVAWRIRRRGRSAPEVTGAPTVAAPKVTSPAVTASAVTASAVTASALAAPTVAATPLPAPSLPPPPLPPPSLSPAGFGPSAAPSSDPWESIY